MLFIASMTRCHFLHCGMAALSPCAPLPVGSSGPSSCAGKPFRPPYSDTAGLDLAHSLRGLSHAGMGQLCGGRAHAGAIVSPLNIAVTCNLPASCSELMNESAYQALS